MNGAATLVCAGTLLVVRANGAPGLELPAAAQDFVTLTLSIVVEAMPFVVLGALVSAAIRVWVPTERLLALLPRGAFLRRVLSPSSGCSCPSASAATCRWRGV